MKSLHRVRINSSARARAPPRHSFTLRTRLIVAIVLSRARARGLQTQRVKRELNERARGLFALRAGPKLPKCDERNGRAAAVSSRGSDGGRGGRGGGGGGGDSGECGHVFDATANFGSCARVRARQASWTVSSVSERVLDARSL